MSDKTLQKFEDNNIRSLISCTNQSKNVLSNHLKAGKSDAINILEPFKRYCEITKNVKNNMHKIDEKNSLMKTVNRNYQELYNCLNEIVSRLDFNEADKDFLLKIDLTDTHNQIEALRIASIFRDNRNFVENFDYGLLKLNAIQNQLQKLNRIREKFSMRIYRLFSNILLLSMNLLSIDQNDNEIRKLSLILLMPPTQLLTSSLSSSSSASSSSNLSAISFANLQYFKSLIENTHKNLADFVSLINWLQIADENAFNIFKNKYIEVLAKFYEKYLHYIFDNEISRVSRKQIKLSSNDFLETSTIGGTLLRSNTYSNELNISTSDNNLEHIILLLGNESEWPIKTEINEHILENCLNEIKDIFKEEEQFCKSFFFNNVNSENLLKNILTKLFNSFEIELKNFNNFLETTNGGCFCMNILIDLNNFITKLKGNLQQPHYLNDVLASNLIQAKRSLDKFMTLQIESVREAKLPRRSPCGLLFYVKNLEKLAVAAQPLLNSNRRTDLEKWYIRLIDSILESILVHSEHHHKTPLEVIRMENFHHLHSTLSQMKIHCLDSQRKEAKQRYNDALNAYVAHYFGKPLEKLNNFFDGIQSRIASGVKASEISYQLAYSKQELRKVIQQYPQKEVRRGLEHLYKKIEKHFSNEVNLTPVVWRAMEQEFILQYKMLDEMIQKCYPGAMIALDFTIDDILKYFSEVK